MADICERAERLMGMDDATWARHANPWSVFTRATCLPLIALAVWSRVWLGRGALGLLALALLWTWLNPRLFARPARMEGWAAEGTLGERLFLARRTRPVPSHHLRMAHLLTAVSAAGIAPLAWGLWVLDPFAVVAGLAMTMLAKLWFVDRMVWLWREVQG